MTQNNLFVMAKARLYSLSHDSSLVELIKARFDFQSAAFHKTYKNILATLYALDQWSSSSCTLTCGKTTSQSGSQSHAVLRLVYAVNFLHLLHEFKLTENVSHFTTSTLPT